MVLNSSVHTFDRKVLKKVVNLFLLKTFLKQNQFDLPRSSFELSLKPYIVTQLLE